MTMTNAPEDTTEDTTDQIGGADAVPDKTADTPAKGASFDGDDNDEDRPSGGDESIRDQD